MRQSGVLAAAGIYALENHVDRLADDHSNAARLAEGLAEFAEVEVATNMVFVHLPADKVDGIAEHFHNDGIRVLPGQRLRLVMHLDLGADDVQTVIASAQKFLS